MCTSKYKILAISCSCLLNKFIYNTLLSLLPLVIYSLCAYRYVLLQMVCYHLIILSTANSAVSWEIPKFTKPSFRLI
jgi:hypothetical protein